MCVPCILHVHPTNRPINFHQTSAPPSRNIATSHSSGVRKFHTWPASTWRGGGEALSKIGSSHLQIEFDSSGRLTPTSGIEPDVSTSPTPSVTGGKGARDKVIRYYKCISRHPLFHSGLSWLGAENIEGNVILWTIWKNFGYSTKGRTKLSLTSSIISSQLFRFVGENLLILFC